MKHIAGPGRVYDLHAIRRRIPETRSVPENRASNSQCRTDGPALVLSTKLLHRARQVSLPSELHQKGLRSHRIVHLPQERWNPRVDVVEVRHGEHPRPPSQPRRVRAGSGVVSIHMNESTFSNPFPRHVRFPQGHAVVAPEQDRALTAPRVHQNDGRLTRAVPHDDDPRLDFMSPQLPALQFACCVIAHPPDVSRP